MAFKKSAPPAVAPDSPDALLLDLPRRKIQGVLHHQGVVLQTYARTALDEPDVALQLPTGSGKTLVGLLIAEWRRIKFNERVVYLCPTRQLVNQVREQAAEQYGLTVNAFTGKAKNYLPSSKTQYQQAERIAVTNYSSLFNTNPFFDDADVILLDDAHAAENYISSLWTVRVERAKEEHEGLYAALAAVLKPLLPGSDFSRLTGDWNQLTDKLWVDKVATPDFARIIDEIIPILDEHLEGSESQLKYPWSMIRDHLRSCQLYIGSQEILIRPLIPPTWTHEAFIAAKQRIYMSATLGTGGDLERLTGRKRIKRLEVPKGWDRQGIGQRFFLFPGMSLKDEEVEELQLKMMQQAGRTLFLVSNDKAAEKALEYAKDSLGFETFNAADIEDSKKPFTTKSQAVAVVANRYDGIDFPGDECRLLMIEGLPKATNLQERFFMNRMGAMALYNDRVLTRVVQAIGRCTRSLNDYSAVVISGEELLDFLTDRKRRQHLHPEIQAEIEFGIEQSKEQKAKDFLENIDVFLKHGQDWEDVYKDIVAKRGRMVQQPLPAMNDLMAVVGQEIAYQEKLWAGDYESALESCERVLAGLISAELRGYRALWHYLAGSAAWLGAEDGVHALKAKALRHFSQAKEAALGIPWLVALSRFQPEVEAAQGDDHSALLKQIERVEIVLAQLGTVHDRAFSREEKFILDGLASENHREFEQAQVRLGRMLGFDADKTEEDATPDPWWMSDDSLCFVFEDHSDAKPKSSLDATKARQAASHPNWIRKNLPVTATARILPVLVTPVSTAKEGALPHLDGVALWRLEDFRKWAKSALLVVRQIRRTFSEVGDLAWRAEAMQAFKENLLAAQDLYTHLESQRASELLKPVK
jgi:hypothetical protein